MTDPEPESVSEPGRERDETVSVTATAAEPSRVLRRSKDDRVIAGVAGGLGRYFGLDPVLLRIAFVLLVFAGGTGLLLYVIGWIAMPEEKAGDAVGGPPARTVPTAGNQLIGLVLLVVGAFLLMRVVLPDVFAGRYVWPLVLIVLGLALLLRGARR